MNKKVLVVIDMQNELLACGYRVGKISLKQRTVRFHPWKQG